MNNKTGRTMNQKQKKYFDDLKNKNIHIIGFLGREAMAVLNCLYNNGVKDITAHDFSERNSAKDKFNIIQTALNEQEKKQEFEKLFDKDITFCFKDEYLKGIEKADIVFVSQNWYTYETNEPLKTEIKKRHIELTNLMDMYFELCEFPIIGVTGSNGKTTTTNIIYQILKQSLDKEVFIAGNDMFQKPVIEKILDYGKDEAVLVLEISNRHLKEFEHKPYIGILTNLSPNHLSEHGGWEGYVRDKGNIFRHITDGYAVINKDDENTTLSALVDDVKCQPVFFSKKRLKRDYTVYLSDNKIVFRVNNKEVELCSLKDIKIRGEHNLENVLASLCAVALMGGDVNKIPEAISSYQPVQERLQFITEFEGVEYYNDISCTTPISAEFALKTLSEGKRNIIHIVGGEDKDMDFTNLNKLINREVKKLLAFPGSGTDKILEEVNPDLVVKFDNTDRALDYAYDIADEGDIVLLSPACAFFKREYVEPKKFDDYVYDLIERKKVK